MQYSLAEDVQFAFFILEQIKKFELIELRRIALYTPLVSLLLALESPNACHSENRIRFALMRPLPLLVTHFFVKWG